MSHVRRIQGRFTTNTASEAYQRQLLAPVKKWRKGWVTPASLPDGSTYKVCKWIRIDEVSKDAGTPLADDEDEDDGDEDEDDGDGDGDVKGGEDEAEDVEVDGDEVETTQQPPTTDLTPAVLSAAPEAMDESDAADIVIEPSAVVDLVAPVVPEEAMDIDETAAGNATDKIVPNSVIQSPAGDTPVEETPFDETTVKTPLEEPSPVIETALETPVITPAVASPAIVSTTVSPAVFTPAVATPTDAAEVSAEPLPESRDPGLVMGEMVPPQAELHVDGEEQQVPPEAE